MKAAPSCKTGLVSVSFRKLSTDAILEWCRKANLQAIEWGGDIHVPHGDEECARAVGQATASAGLEVCAYGSYYGLGVSEGEGLSFDRVLRSAQALGAKSIRVWAGNRSSAQADTAWKNAVVSDALHCADRSEKYGIPLCYEWHSGTLTDTPESAMELLQRTEHPGIQTLWQPLHGLSQAATEASLLQALPRLHHLHVFDWHPTPDFKNSLASPEARKRWHSYLALVQGSGYNPACLIEFPPEESLEALCHEAHALQDILHATSLKNRIQNSEFRSQNNGGCMKDR